MLLGLPQSPRDIIIAMHLNIGNYLTRESMILSPSPQPKRGSQRQSRLATTLPRFPHTLHPSSLRVSLSPPVPMDRPRRHQYLIINLATYPRRMPFRTSSRSFIAISRNSRQNFLLTRANHKMRVELSLRVVHRLEPMMWRKRDGRKR